MTDAPKTDHAYDGIEEFDNPLPGWWKWLFVASILFSPFYWIYVHGGAEGRSVADKYEVANAANTRMQFEEIGNLEPNEATLVQYMNEEKWVSFGRSVFQANCVSCHNNQGEGKVGPNLTDEHYKNVNNIEDIAKVINEGAGNGAMPKWAGRLHPNEVVLVSAYVAQLRGQDVAGGTAAEGKVIPPWPEPSPEQEDPPGEEAAG